MTWVNTEDPIDSINRSIRTLASEGYSAQADDLRSIRAELTRLRALVEELESKLRILEVADLPGEYLRLERLMEAKNEGLRGLVDETNCDCRKHKWPDGKCPHDIGREALEKK